MKKANALPGHLRWGATRGTVPIGSTSSAESGDDPETPSKENEDRTARPVEFDKQEYRGRNVIERLIGWLKESHRIFSRFEKTAKNFGGMITPAFIRQYLQYEPV